jgi:hypothetical protein
MQFSLKNEFLNTLLIGYNFFFGYFEKMCEGGPNSEILNICKIHYVYINARSKNECVYT